MQATEAIEPLDGPAAAQIGQDSRVYAASQKRYS
jgi:hypothetical protein